MYGALGWIWGVGLGQGTVVGGPIEISLLATVGPSRGIFCNFILLRYSFAEETILISYLSPSRSPSRGKIV